MARIRNVAAAYMAALQAQERDAETELMRQYFNLSSLLLDESSVLSEMIAAAVEAGEAVSPSWLYRQERYRILQEQLTSEMRRITEWQTATTTQLQSQAVVLGDEAAQAVLQSQGLRLATRLPNEQLIDLIGRASNGSPLRELFDQLGTDVSQRITMALVEGVGSGQGVEAIARNISDALGGNMSRAMTISRTEVVGSYRRANQRNAQRYSRLLQGWKWSASLGNTNPPPCPVCIAMHGQMFPLDVPFESHANCRCVPIHVVNGADPADFGPSGEAWFAAQPAAYQQSVLRKGEYAAYQDGTLTLSDLVQYKSDPDWGGSRTRRPLRDILGQQQVYQMAAD